MFKKLVFTLTYLTLVCIPIVNANVISGDISSLHEAHLFTWGNNPSIHSSWTTHELSQVNGVVSGWIYGSNTSWASNTDVYVYSGGIDIASVTNAAAFDYKSQPQSAKKGDTIFFHGLNGFYGAWTINSFSVSNPEDEDIMNWQLFMHGKWYFQDDGTADFSKNKSSVPEPSSIALLVFGLLLLRTKYFLNSVQKSLRE